MAWKKALVVVSIVFAGSIGRTAAFAVNGNDESRCWEQYVTEVIQSSTDVNACLRDLGWFGALGTEWCGFLYVEQIESALFQYFACVFGVSP